MTKDNFSLNLTSVIYYRITSRHAILCEDRQGHRLFPRTSRSAAQSKRTGEVKVIAASTSCTKGIGVVAWMWWVY
jgi:hypothetical protein